MYLLILALSGCIIGSYNIIEINNTAEVAAEAVVDVDVAIDPCDLQDTDGDTGRPWWCDPGMPKLDDFLGN